MRKSFARRGVLCVAMLMVALHGFSQAQHTWSGQVQCQLGLQSQGYVHQEIQTWTLTGGAPTQQGAMQVYPATWSVTGQGGAQRAQGAQVMAAQWNSSVPGMSAPIAIFVRASDNRLMIKLWHAQLAAFGATNSVRQVGAAQTSAAYTAYEWPFPAIDDVATSTNVSGTGTVQVSGNSMPVPSANAGGIATCKWQFSKGGSATPQNLNAPREIAMSSTPQLSMGANANPQSPAGAAADTASVGSASSSVGGAAPIANSGNTSGAAVGAAGAGNPNIAAGGVPLAASGNIAGAASSPAAGAAGSAAGGAPADAGGATSGSSVIPAPASSLSVSQASVMSPAGASQVQAIGNTPMASVVKPPPPPTGFKATSWDLGAVHFEWQPVTGATKYRLDGPGLDASGVYVSAPATNATANHIPPGPGTWKLASVNAAGTWDRNNEASASAIVRYAPSHSTPWLTKNNGTGSAALAIAHYLAACPACAPGVTFGTVAAALGLPQSMIQSTCNGQYGSASCSTGLIAHDDFGNQWSPEAVYSNITEFGTTRTAMCWNVSIPVGSPGLPPRVLCYSNSGNHGLTVISKDMQYAWFMTFSAPSPSASIFDYKLTTDITFDSEGPKHAPHACLSCHGGQWSANGARVTGATLLPLDPGMLQVTDTGRFMSLNFLGVNQAVMTSLPSPAVTRYITGLYGGDPRQIARPNPLDDGSIGWTFVSGSHYGGYGGTPWPNMDFVPAGWAQQVDLYKNTVKPHCMMCHLATPSNLDFSTYGSFAQNKTLIYSEVCSTHTMPHASYPYTQFWTKDTGQTFVPGWLVGSLGYTSCP